jgi:hypothetical protein
MTARVASMVPLAFGRLAELRTRLRSLSQAEPKRTVLATCSNSGVVLFSRLQMRPRQLQALRTALVLRCPACRTAHVFERDALRLSER